MHKTTICSSVPEYIDGIVKSFLVCNSRLSIIPNTAFYQLSAIPHCLPSSAPDHCIFVSMDLLTLGISMNKLLLTICGPFMPSRFTDM